MVRQVLASSKRADLTPIALMAKVFLSKLGMNEDPQYVTAMAKHLAKLPMRYVIRTRPDADPDVVFQWLCPLTNDFASKTELGNLRTRSGAEPSVSVEDYDKLAVWKAMAKIGSRPSTVDQLLLRRSWEDLAVMYLLDMYHSGTLRLNRSAKAESAGAKISIQMADETPTQLKILSSFPMAKLRKRFCELINCLHNFESLFVPTKFQYPVVSHNSDQCFSNGRIKLALKGYIDAMVTPEAWLQATSGLSMYKSLKKPAFSDSFVYVAEGLMFTESTGLQFVFGRPPLHYYLEKTSNNNQRPRVVNEFCKLWLTAAVPMSVRDFDTAIKGLPLTYRSSFNHLVSSSLTDFHNRFLIEWCAATLSEQIDVVAGVDVKGDALDSLPYYSDVVERRSGPNGENGKGTLRRPQPFADRQVDIARSNTIRKITQYSSDPYYGFAEEPQRLQRHNSIWDLDTSSIRRPTTFDGQMTMPSGRRPSAIANQILMNGGRNTMTMGRRPSVPVNQTAMNRSPNTFYNQIAMGRPSMPMSSQGNLYDTRMPMGGRPINDMTMNSGPGDSNGQMTSGRRLSAPANHLRMKSRVLGSNDSLTPMDQRLRNPDTQGTMVRRPSVPVNQGTMNGRSNVYDDPMTMTRKPINQMAVNSGPTRDDSRTMVRKPSVPQRSMNGRPNTYDDPMTMTRIPINQMAVNSGPTVDDPRTIVRRPSVPVNQGTMSGRSNTYPNEFPTRRIPVDQMATNHGPSLPATQVSPTRVPSVPMNQIAMTRRSSTPDNQMTMRRKPANQRPTGSGAGVYNNPMPMGQRSNVAVDQGTIFRQKDTYDNQMAMTRRPSVSDDDTNGAQGSNEPNVYETYEIGRTGPVRQEVRGSQQMRNVPDTSSAHTRLRDDTVKSGDRPALINDMEQRDVESLMRNCLAEAGNHSPPSERREPSVPPVAKKTMYAHFNPKLSEVYGTTSTYGEVSDREPESPVDMDTLRPSTRASGRGGATPPLSTFTGVPSPGASVMESYRVESVSRPARSQSPTESEHLYDSVYSTGPVLVKAVQSQPPAHGDWGPSPASTVMEKSRPLPPPPPQRVSAPSDPLKQEIVTLWNRLKVSREQRNFDPVSEPKGDDNWWRSVNV